MKTLTSSASPTAANSRRPRLSLIVPLFNERLRVGETIDEIVRFTTQRAGGGEVIYVDDGSSDGTADYVGRHLASSGYRNARVISLPHAGKGSAVQAGIEAATGDLIGFCDVDLATPLSDLERLCSIAAIDDLLVIASRGLEGSVITRHESLLRENLGRLYNLLLRLLLVPGVRDTQCGAKVARRSVWERILPHCVESGFAWDVEVCVLARDLEIKIEEIPVIWAHDARSTVRTMSDGFRMLQSLWAIHRRITSSRAHEQTSTMSGLVLNPVPGSVSPPQAPTSPAPVALTRRSL
jgi:dolichyl-phosphate beta-glucosyltransferase